MAVDEEAITKRPARHNNVGEMANQMEISLAAPLVNLKIIILCRGFIWTRVAVQEFMVVITQPTVIDNTVRGDVLDNHFGPFTKSITS